MEERSMRKKPVVLMILDGYGLNDKVEGNACLLYTSIQMKIPWAECNS